MSSVSLPAHLYWGQAPRFIELKSSRLRVDFALPGTLYNGTRFDWSGFVTQVTLDDRHTFCAPEQIDGTGTGGIGLCNEFGIMTAVGYPDAPPGEQFVKPGVGLLTRKDERPYFFALPWSVEPFIFETQSGPDFITVTTLPRDCRGYALHLEKTFRVQANILTIDYVARNVGSKRIVVDEYNHNFISINGRNTGPGMRLRFPFMIQPAMPAEPILHFEEKSVTLPQILSRPIHRHLVIPQRAAEYWWEITDEPSGATVRETSDTPWHRAAFWATFRLMCPEVFVLLDVEPGQTQRWRRTYTFSG